MEGFLVIRKLGGWFIDGGRVLAVLRAIAKNGTRGRKGDRFIFPTLIPALGNEGV